jgi:DNA repair photolyase
VIEPGTASPRGRLELVREVTVAGLGCHVLVAPVLPYLTDSDEALDALLGRIAAAGAGSASVMALHLRPGAREWYFAMLERDYPALVPAYRRLYAGSSYATSWYRDDLAARVTPLLERHGLGRSGGGSSHRDVAATAQSASSAVPTLF